jgi:dolichyl-phosphate-mannose-protein mannosyltransferase
VVKQYFAIVAIVLALRLPFLHQAIQGDDLYYLYGAEHAQIEPLHPDHAKYLFMGDLVEMRGHSHPPLNSWILGALLWSMGDVREVPFHAVYSIFSILAALAMFSLARRFCDQPFLATLLFIAVPAFVVNGNSLETDLPFLALWMLAVAWFVKGIEDNSSLALLGSALAAAIAALDAYQAVFLVPILAFYLWQKKNRSALAWYVIFAAPLAIGAWQVYGRITGGAMPAGLLWDYMRKYGWQVLTQKVKNAAALTVHCAWILSPLLIRGNRWNWILGAIASAAGAFYDPNPMFWASLGLGVVVLSSCVRRGFLEAWILLFFAGALVVFFAGSARYLLPIAAPLAILAANRCSTPMVCAGFALQMALSLGFTIVNYQTWDAYRQFAISLAPEAAERRMWVESDFGLRYYLESEGALAVPREHIFAPGDVVVSPNPHPEGQPIATLEIRPAIPLRLFSLNEKSAYSAAAHGLWPFEFSTAPVDRVAAYIIGERKAELTWVTPRDQQQILRGLDPDGWTSSEATVLLKHADGPLTAEFTIHPQSPARQIRLLIDGRQVAEQTFPAPGSYTLSAPTPSGAPSITVTLAVDKTFSVPGDGRHLGILVTGIGFKQ